MSKEFVPGKIYVANANLRVDKRYYRCVRRSDHFVFFVKYNPENGGEGSQEIRRKVHEGYIGESVVIDKGYPSKQVRGYTIGYATIYAVDVYTPKKPDSQMHPFGL